MQLEVESSLRVSSVITDTSQPTEKKGLGECISYHYGIKVSKNLSSWGVLSCMSSRLKNFGTSFL